MKHDIKNTYDIRYDFVRIVSMILIIAIHVSSTLVVDFGEIPMIDWNIANFVDSFSRMAVNIFFLISGALLLAKDDGIVSFYSKRLSKIIIPFIFWTTFYTVWGKYYKQYEMSIKETLKGAYKFQSYYHLWFLYAIIMFYLFTPLFKMILKHISKKWAVGICILWLIALTPNFLNKFSMLEGKLPIIKWSYTNFDYIVEYGAYYVLGYALVDYLHKLDKRKTTIFGIITFISNFIIFIGTSFLSIKSGVFQGKLYYSPSIFVAISSVTGYIFLYGFSDIIYERLEKRKNLISKVSYCSLGVYLIHICVLEVLRNQFFGEKLLYSVTPIIGIPILIAATLVVSTTIVYFGKKVPLIKHIF
ncbi:acyltransferase [Clostridium algidicarnis]|uniref:Acyltransferase family protein n=1 Tax=Clostridium algidicarnis TaxID=37659 RepID=A0ABS6C262_9CLOT|nr:acyltransferase family protein [Clostridium algidicarnis]MBU3219573.1 acyltransferase family protein [Clostridium algidicarnis]